MIVEAHFANIIATANSVSQSSTAGDACSSDTLQDGRDQKAVSKLSIQKSTADALNNSRYTTNTNRIDGSNIADNCRAESRDKIYSLSSSTEQISCFTFLVSEKRLDICPKPVIVCKNESYHTDDCQSIHEKENIENDAISHDVRYRSNSFKTNEYDDINYELTKKIDYQNDKDKDGLENYPNLFTTAAKLSISSPQKDFTTVLKNQRMPIGSSWGKFDFSHGIGGSGSWGGDTERLGVRSLIPLSGLKFLDTNSGFTENCEINENSDSCMMEIYGSSHTSGGIKTVKKRNFSRSSSDRRKKKNRDKQESSTTEKKESIKITANLEKKRGRCDDDVEGRDYTDEINIEDGGNCYRSVESVGLNKCSDDCFLNDRHLFDRQIHSKNNIIDDNNNDNNDNNNNNNSNDNNNNNNNNKYNYNNNINNNNNNNNNNNSDNNCGNNNNNKVNDNNINNNSTSLYTNVLNSKNASDNLKPNNKENHQKSNRESKSNIGYMNNDNAIKNQFYDNSMEDDNDSKFRNRYTTFAPRKSLLRNLRNKTENRSSPYSGENDFVDSQRRRILRGHSDTTKKRETISDRTYVQRIIIPLIFIDMNYH